MSYKEEDIIAEFGSAWVLRSQKNQCYYVMVSDTVSASESAYVLNDDGLSIALARAKYLSGRIKGGFINLHELHRNLTKPKEV